ncbi:MAG: YciI family protein [Agriterribacter sp.]
MPQYVIIAHDGNDADALNRRMKARPAHLDTARKLKTNNNFIIGGAMLDKQQQMNGSVMIVEFENEEKLNEWMQNDPYMVNNVWQQVTVSLFRVADV